MKILEIETEHTGPFKVLFEVLKDMLTEATVEFISVSKKESDNASETEQDDTDTEESKKNRTLKYMRINAVNSTQSVLINLRLDGVNFNKFICKRSKLTLGINLSIFYKLIKNMGKNDILSLDMDLDNKNQLNIKIDSENKKEVKVRMKLLDLDEVEFQIPDIHFDAVITMNSQEFNKLCREMHNIDERMEIKCLHDKIIFTSNGADADKSVTYKCANADDEEDDNNLVSICHASQTEGSDSPQIVQGIFELKNLVLFSKCASLSGEIEIFMKNNIPLVIKYTVATLGRILLCLAPVNEDSTKNANYSDEEAYYSDDE